MRNLSSASHGMVSGSSWEGEVKIMRRKGGKGVGNHFNGGIDKTLQAI
jgi:hypothetical protein